MSIPEQALRNRKFISFHKKISNTLLNDFLRRLHIDTNKDDDQVIVASSQTFRIYDIFDKYFQERANLRSSKHNLNYSCNDVCWNKIDNQIVATGKHFFNIAFLCFFEFRVSISKEQQMVQ